MARNAWIELNRAGVRELLTSAEMQAEVMRRAHAIAARAGSGHSVKNTTTNRARATVRTETDDARHREAKNRNLTFAIDAGRG